MTNTHAKGPRPAFVEDYDDDKNTVISSTREVAKTTKNRKDGSDSGYSSKAGTAEGDNHGTQKGMADVKLSGLPLERQRNPYSKVPAAGRRESVHEQRPAPRPSAPVRATTEPNRFCHPKGVCVSCDFLGYHLTQEEWDALQNQINNRAAFEDKKTARPGKQPSSTFKDAEQEKKTRGMSLHTDVRPPMPYPPSATRVMPAVVAMRDPYQATYATSPGTATYKPRQPAFPYSQTPLIPSTPRRGPQQNDGGYFGPYDSDPARPIPRHRNSMHEGTDPLQSGYDRYDYGHVDPLSYSNPKQAGSYKRPGTQQFSSYNERDRHYWQERDNNSDQRKYPSSKQPYDNEFADHGPLPARTRDLSPRRQSLTDESAYVAGRPKPRHSVSDSQPLQSTSSRFRGQEPVSRRTTQPTTAVDAKLAVAEAYQERQGSATPAETSTNKVKESGSSHTRTRSETGSNLSHRESHFSSSKASTQSKRSRRGSIIIETSGSRPLSISIPNGPVVTIGTGSEKSATKVKEPRLIEHAPPSPSATSKTSTTRSRAATSIHTSSDRGRERDHGVKTIRRISHIIDGSRPPSSPIKASSREERTSSRAPSRSRASTDVDSRRR